MEKRQVIMHSKPSKNPKKSRVTIGGIIDYEARTISIHGARNNTKLNETFKRSIGAEIALGRAAKKPIKVIKLNNTKDKKKIQQKFYDAANIFIKHPNRLNELVQPSR